MKKIIPFLFLVAAVQMTYGQCTPNPMYQDSAFGVWPDTITNFPPAQLNMAYNTVIDVKIPEDAGAVDPLFTGTDVDSAVVANVSGLPPGLIYDCNSQTPAPCTFLGNSAGCAAISGTPTMVGTFPLTIELIGYVTFVGNALPVPLAFGGYKIVVSGPNGLNDPSLYSAKLMQNVPNPFEIRTDIPFTLMKNSEVELNVSTILGKEILVKKIQGLAGENTFEFDASLLGSGLYLYSITTDGQKITRKMFVKK